METERRHRSRYHRCPKCDGTSVQRDLNQRLMDMLIWRRLGYRAYSCRDCGNRFRDRPINEHSED